MLAAARPVGADREAVGSERGNLLFAPLVRNLPMHFEKEHAHGQPIQRIESLLPPDRRSCVFRCFTEDGTVIFKQASDAREVDGLFMAPVWRLGSSRGMRTVGLC